MSPHDGLILGDAVISTQEEVSAKVAAARAATSAWQAQGLAGRAAHVRQLLQHWARRAEEFAQLASKEMGMPVGQARGDVADAIGYLTWYVDHAQQYLSPQVSFENGEVVHTVYREPYGVAAVIAPWNYPATNFVWGCGQNLVAGNTVVFKHSEEVPLCGKLIDELVQASNFPPGVLTQVYGRGPVGALLARQEVDLICFTGSSAVGESLYRVAAAGMKKIVMELGGSAPGVVFEDADLGAATAAIYDARFSNSGQQCDGLKRLLVHESIWDPMVEKLADKLRMVTLGNPLDERFTLGPLVNKKQVELLERQVADALAKGALVVAGGKQPGLSGAYYEPTLLTNITRDMRVWQEEVFGPVLPILKFRTEAEAVALANDTEFGLGAYVYTKDRERAARVAAQLQTGMVSINGTSYTGPTNPFGGYKRSGLGRLQGRWGFEEVTQTKVVAGKKV